MFSYLDYLPAFLRDVRELVAIGEAADAAAVQLQIQADQVLANRLIETADLPTLQRWERILGLEYNPVYTLEERRQQIIGRMRMQSVITLEKLTDLLNDITDEGATVAMNYENYKLTVRVALKSKYNYNNVDKLLRDVVPANIVIDLSLLYNQHRTLRHYTHRQLAAMTRRQVREEVLPNAN